MQYKYQDHFNLRETPFSLTPDPDYFYNFVGHQQVLNVLLVALKGGEGLIKITGEVGTGKTLLCPLSRNVWSCFRARNYTNLSFARLLPDLL